MANVFWDAHGVIFIDYLEKGKAFTGPYYAVLLDQLVDEIRKKRLHLEKKKILFHDNNAPSYTLNIARVKSINWVSNRFRIHCILQTWPPATIICSQTSRDGCVVGVLSRTKKLNGKLEGISKGLTNRILWKAWESWKIVGLVTSTLKESTLRNKTDFWQKNKFLYILLRLYRTP